MKLTDVLSEHEKLLVGVFSFAGFLALWQLLASVNILDPIFFGHPLAVARTGIEMFGSGEVFDDIEASGLEFLLGFAGAIVVGIPIGLLMARVEVVNHFLSPFVSALYATPRMALLPLLIMWLGIGLWSKVALVFLGALFPILLNTFDGARNVQPGLIEVAKSYGASDRDILLKVVLIATVPFVVAGLRLGIGVGLIMVIVAELLGSNKGLGFIVTTAFSRLDPARIFVAAAIMVIFALAANWTAKAIERRLAPWLHMEREW